MMRLPKFVRLIECSSLEFDNVSVIHVRDKSDFLFLIKRTKIPIVYKKNGSYYLFGEDTLWVFVEKDGRKKVV